MKLSEIQRQLKEPFPPDVHKERDLPGGGKWFYVPWQVIRDRLDDICPDWEVEYTDPVQFDELCTIRCTLKICGVSRSAPGNAPMRLISSSGKDMSRGTAIERAIADAFKNAAEAFGIGAYLDEQSQDKREFTIKYLHKSGDSRAYKAARENGWIPSGNLPTGHDNVRRQMDEHDRSLPKLVISEAQRKRLWAIATKEHGFTSDGLNRFLKTQGFESDKTITTDRYGKICAMLNTPDIAEIYNQVEPVTEDFDREPVNQAIADNISRLGWTRKQAREFLMQNFDGKDTRDKLTEAELIAACQKLDAIPVSGGQEVQQTLVS